MKFLESIASIKKDNRYIFAKKIVRNRYATKGCTFSVILMLKGIFEIQILMFDE